MKWMCKTSLCQLGDIRQEILTRKKRLLHILSTRNTNHQHLKQYNWVCRDPRRTALKSSPLRGRVCSDPRRTALKSSPLRGRVCSDPWRTALKSSSLRGRVCSDPRRSGSFVCCLLLCKLTKTNKFWYRCVSLLYWQGHEMLWMWLKNLLNYQLKIMTGGLYRPTAYGKG